MGESFTKRQKERARQEKQRDKMARRQQRKLEGPNPEGSYIIAADETLDGGAETPSEPDVAPGDGDAGPSPK